VVVLLDEVIGHLTEPVRLSDAENLKTVDRVLASGTPAAYQPYAVDGDQVPAMARPGDGYRVHTTGLTHAESGYPTQNPETVARVNHRLLHKLDNHAGEIECVEVTGCEEADIVVVAYGITARAARGAVRLARKRGIKAGLFRPVTLWPFPEQALLAASNQAQALLVPEMNAGQLVLEVERLCASGTRVAGLNRIDGEPIAPAEIADRIGELHESGRH
jgi:2-oxoglutarate ferredoxin oxidoreductase subunit alpha